MELAILLGALLVLMAMGFSAHGSEYEHLRSHGDTFLCFCR